MTNHCVNVLRAKNKKSANIKEILKNFLKNPEVLDFNKIIEMPKELRTSMKPLEELCEETHRSPKFLDKKIKRLERQIKEKNLEDYGFETPEEWALENWGTEYNCYDFHWDTQKNSAVFDTLDYPPLPVIAEIAKSTKTTLLLTYAEPENHRYGQLCVYPDGECEFKDYVEETIPEEFHHEFPNQYPPQGPTKNTLLKKSAKKRNKSLNKQIEI